MEPFADDAERVVVEKCLREHETRLVSFPTYITENNRSKLLRWVSDVHKSLGYEDETFYLTVHLVDLMFSKGCHPRDQIQLVGVACLVIAGKFYEVEPAEITEFVYFCDNLYTHDNIVRMEQQVLQVCEFRLNVPLTCQFLELLLLTNDGKGLNAKKKLRHKTIEYYREIAGEFPSQIAKNMLLLL